MAKQYHIKCTQADKTVIDCLFEETQISKQKLKQALTKGAVWLSGKHGITRVRKAKKQLYIGDELYCYYDENILSQTPTQPTLVKDLVHYSIWVKPAGMFSQGSKWGDHCTINRWVETNLTPQRPAFIVHRLDRATSGLMIIAHSKKMAQVFSKMFADHKIEKIYHAKVNGLFPKDTQNITDKVDSKTAYSIVNLISFDDELNQSLLSVKIETGRKHQIRVHLANYGFAIIGDRLYGDKTTKQDLQLCCYQLNFKCPLDEQQKSFTNKDCLNNKRLGIYEHIPHHSQGGISY